MTTPSDATIARVVTEYIHGSDHPDLVVYRRDFGSKFDAPRWVGEIRRRCELGAFRGRRLLEVGCGFGWDAVGLSLAGGSEVVAIDVLPSMIEGMTECLAAIAAKGRVLRVSARQGDICSLDLPDGSFDGIHSSEAVEHVRDLDAMFRRCFALLRPGGRLLIVNDSNRFNSAFREATFKMWKERDESWEHARWLRDEVRPVEHRDAKPYAVMREAVIRGAAPRLDDPSVARLVRATAGMVRTEIVAATTAFLAGAPPPDRPAYAWCRNPETGEYAERLLDPFELASLLRDSGFRNVKVRHGFNRLPLRLLNGVQLRPLNQILFELRGLFYVVADKPFPC
jgi:SAM-dependent methyltransferase